MGASGSISVLVAEDQDMVRGALVALLKLEPDIEVVAEVQRGDEVMDAAAATQPDVALLDLELPGVYGLDCIAPLRRLLPACRIVVLTTFARPGLVRRAMEDGASGFLPKSAPATELATAIRRVVGGERVIAPELAVRALAEGENPLTPREREILLAAADGSTVKEIARRLHVSPGTVRNHVSTAMGKLGASTRAEAVLLADEQGWLEQLPPR